MSVAPNELAIIRKVDTTKYRLHQIVAKWEDDVDIIILEGFKKLIGENPSVPKIVAVKTAEEVVEASGHYKPILTFVGPISNEAERLEIPYVDVLKEPEKLVGLVNRKAAVLAERKRKDKEELRIQIDERVLPLNPFVQRVVKNIVLGIISALKGVAIKGDETISVIVRSFSKHE